MTNIHSDLITKKNQPLLRPRRLKSCTGTELSPYSAGETGGEDYGHEGRGQGGGRWCRSCLKSTAWKWVFNWNYLYYVINLKQVIII